MKKITFLLVIICVYLGNSAFSQTDTTLNAGYSDKQSFSTVPTGFTVISDPNFEQALIDLDIDSGEIDGLVLTANISDVTRLNISNKRINNLAGIEAFTSLTHLNCNYNQLTNLDISKNTALTSLNCNSNQLTNLDVSKNTALTFLDCGYNQLTSLDVSTNTALISLRCRYNLIKSLDVSTNTALTDLYCNSNQLTSLDVSTNTDLTYLHCFYNKLTDLDVSTNTVLAFLYCNDNQLTGLDVSTNTSLTVLNCNNNSLRSLNIKNGNIFGTFSALNNPHLRCINTDNPSISKVELGAASMIDSQIYFSLDCYATTPIPSILFEKYLHDNGIDTNGITGDILNDDAAALISLAIGKGNTESSINGIRDLAGIEAFTSLESLTVLYELLEGSLDLSKNTALTYLNLKGNQLTGLDVSKNTALTHLNCEDNELLYLNIKNGHNADFTVVRTGRNPLLTCILVDDENAEYLSSDMWHKNSDTQYSSSSDGCGSILITDITLTSLTSVSATLTGNIISNDISAITERGFVYSLSNSSDLIIEGEGVLKIPSSGSGTGVFSVIIADLTMGTAYYYRAYVITNDNEMIYSIKGVFNPLPLHGVAILDSNFEQALIDLRIDSGEIDGFVLTADISDVTRLNISNKGINNLAGIEAFTSLTSLDCSNNQLMSLDVSANTALTSLNCNYNQLTSLDVSINTDLTSLYCDENKLTSLDISANTALTFLSCNNNKLTSLDVSTNTALITLRCRYNLIKSLDVSTNTALTTLHCNSNQLTSLDVSTNTDLTYLYCFYNKLTDLDVSTNTALAFLYCNDNQLTGLDVSTNTSLTVLTCNNNSLRSLNIKNGNIFSTFSASNNPHLRCINTDNPSNSKIHLGKVTMIDSQVYFSLDCYATTPIPSILFEKYLHDNGIDTNGITGDILNDDAAALISLTIGEGNTESSINGIRDLAGIEAFTSLESLTVLYELLEGSLYLSKNTALTYLNLKGNQLTGLDVSKNTALTHLNCEDNELLYLNIKNGHNADFTAVRTRKNPLLTCIFVDDENAEYLYSDIWLKNSGTQYTSSSSDDCASISTAILDPNFEQALIDLDYDSGEINGFVLTANISDVTSLDIRQKEISDLTGIEGFTSLTYLNCNYNQLTNLDVSKNTALTALGCAYNQLTDLDVSENTALISLACVGNELTSLDFSQNTALAWFVGNNNKLTSLNVSQNTALKLLYCNNNELTSLDVSANTSLTSLNCDNNQLLELNVSANTALRKLYCSNNKLMSLDVSNNSKLIHLVCYSNVKQVSSDVATRLLTDLDVSQNTALTFLVCFGNKLTSLDVSASTNLTTLNCYNNELIGLDVSQNTALTSLVCGYNQLRSLNVSASTALARLDCRRNLLTTLDVSANTALTYLSCRSNLLTSLDISANTDLVYLNLNYNNLEELDVSNNSKLTELRCKVNRLTSLNIANGNNSNLIFFKSVNNPNLTCIQVDNLGDIRNRWYKDATVDYSTHCAVDTAPSFGGATMEDQTYTVGTEVYLSLPAANGGNGNLSYALFPPLPDGLIIFGTLAFDTGGGNVIMGNPSTSATSTEYTLTVTDADRNTDVTDTDSLTFTITVASITKIPDTNFEQALIDLGIDSGAINGVVLTANIADITSLDVSKKSNTLSEKISNLAGIEDFTALTSLNCNGNQLTSLDVSGNTALAYLYCRGNELTSLNVSANTDLIYLNANMNSLEELNVSNNSKLTYLRCKNNQLTSLNVANGNNSNFLFFKSIGNPNLTCIQIDDIGDNRNEWRKDSTTIYSEDCSSTTSIAKSKQEKTIPYFDGNKDSELIGFSISPNPTSGVLSITVDEKVDYRLLNIRGQTLKTGILNVGENKINLSSFAKGIYLLNIKTSKGSFTEKVVRN